MKAGRFLTRNTCVEEPDNIFQGRQKISEMVIISFLFFCAKNTPRCDGEGIDGISQYAYNGSKK